MERVRKQQLLEQSIYGVIWSVIFFLPLIGEYFAVSGGLEKEEVRTLVRDSWLGILPFFMLFLFIGTGSRCIWGEAGLSDDESPAFRPKQTVAPTRTDTVFRPE